MLSTRDSLSINTNILNIKKWKKYTKQIETEGDQG